MAEEKQEKAESKRAASRRKWEIPGRVLGLLGGLFLDGSSFYLFLYYGDIRADELGADFTAPGRLYPRCPPR